MTLWKPTRRKLLVGAAASGLAKPALAWFPHGKQVVSSQGPLVINITHDVSWNYISNGGNFPNLPDTTKASADAVVARAVSDMQTWFCSGTSSTATVNINIGWGANGGGAMAGVACSYTSNGPTTHYSDLRTILLGLPMDNAKALAYDSANLPVSSPSNLDSYGGFFPTSGLWAIWHGTTDTHTQYSGWVSTPGYWDFTVDGKSCSSGPVGFYQSITHEFTFALGRDNYMAMLWNYTAPGTRASNFADLSNSGRYLSLDHGTTNPYPSPYGHFVCTTSFGGSSEYASLADTPTSPFNAPVTHGPWSIGAGNAQYWSAPDFQYMACLVPMTDAGKALLGI